MIYARYAFVIDTIKRPGVVHVVGLKKTTCHTNVKIEMAII